MGSRSIERIRRRRKEDRLWFGVSLGLHCIALVAIIYLTPVREIVRQVTQQIQPPATMSASVLRDLSASLDERAADQIKENAKELDRVLTEMGGIQSKMSVQFSAFAEQQADTAAADAVQDMQQAVTQMGSAVESIGRDAPIEETDRYQALAEQAQQRAGEKLGMTPFDVSAAAEAHKNAQDVHQAAKAGHDQDRTLRDQARARQQALTAEQTRADEQHKVLDAARQQEKRVAEVERLTKQAQDLDQRVTDAKDALAKTQQQETQAHQDALNKQKDAIQAQNLALAALQAAIERHKQQVARGTAAAGAAQAQSGAPTGASAEQAGARDQMDVPALYDSARSGEDNIAASLKEIRAMDLAMVRDIKLDAARSDIDVVRPVRPVLDADLLRKEVGSTVRLEAHKAELRKALRETNSMVNLAHRMLEMADQSVEKMKFGTDVPMEAYLPDQRPDFELIIRELAMEDVAGRVSDVSGMMQQAAAQMLAPGQRMQGEGQEAGAPMRPMQDIKDLTQDVQGEEAMMQMGFGEGEGSFPKLPPDVPAVGAHVLGPNGRPTEFMYIDSWYTIGPFPNPNRINIDREFPPDSLIDLDATYTGKDGRTIRWQFVQSDKPQVIPADPDQYGIWYAYTEFNCDKPRDVWIAAGTDDRGTLKINGVPVWISSKRLKGWEIDEVWRRVHLQQGVNRILYRVENGWLHVGYSLVLKLDDQ